MNRYKRWKPEKRSTQSGSGKGRTGTKGREARKQKKTGNCHAEETGRGERSLTDKAQNQPHRKNDREGAQVQINLSEFY